MSRSPATGALDRDRANAKPRLDGRARPRRRHAHCGGAMSKTARCARSPASARCPWPRPAALLPEPSSRSSWPTASTSCRVAHVGRAVSAHVRTRHRGARPRRAWCPGCDVAMGLEIDHWQTDFGDKGPDGAGQPGPAVPLPPLHEDLPGLHAAGRSRDVGVGTPAGVRLRLRPGAEIPEPALSRRGTTRHAGAIAWCLWVWVDRDRGA